MAYEFETYMSVRAALLPDEYLRLLAQRHGQTFKRDDPVDDVMVRVDYNPGWYVPAKIYGPPENCHPAEGEDPEITTLTLLEDDWEMKWDPNLSREEWEKLTQECIEDQPKWEDEPDYY